MTPLVACCAAVMTASTPAQGVPPPAVALGTQFVAAELEDAIAAGRQQHRATVVVFSAKWCEACGKLQEQVFETSHGNFLSQRAQAIKVDFDAAETRPLVERFSVISLPTVVVLRPDGSEIGRVEGYDRRRAFVADMRELLDGRDTLAACEARLAKSRGDIKALFCAGKAHLDRGRAELALPMLEEVLVRDPSNRAKVTDQTLFVLGRYFARVRQQPRPARHYFRELDARFPQTEYGAGAAWWYARSLHKIGSTELGYLYLAERAGRLRKADAVVELASYALLTGLNHQDALGEVRKALRRSPGNGELKRVRDRLGQELLAP